MAFGDRRPEDRGFGGIESDEGGLGLRLKAAINL